ncbi:hypothetical protein [Bacillus timonensis]|uniref:hypothetical protein n=1 Tax=Bacillus timonensis TaxID=1033734 RepID=UPI000289A6E1|nr:hypothetical protein [Bacillus timonensis]
MLKLLRGASILFMVFFFSFSLTAFANGDDQRFIIEGDRVHDTETDKEYGSATKYNDKGELEEVSLDALKKLLENEGKVDILNEFQEKIFL